MIQVGILHFPFWCMKRRKNTCDVSGGLNEHRRYLNERNISPPPDDTYLVRIGRVASCGTATHFKNDVPQISLLLKAFRSTGIQILCKCTPVFPTFESILSYGKIIKERQKRGESQSMLKQEKMNQVQVIYMN